MMLPYTRISLKRKKSFIWVFLRFCFRRRPSPTRNRPGLDNGLPEGPNEFSTTVILSRFSFRKVNWSMFASVAPTSVRGAFIPVWAVRERTFHSESGDKHVEQEVKKKKELYLECRCMEFYLKGRVEKRWEFTSESLIKDFQIQLDWILVKKKTKLGLCQCQDVQGKLKKDY